MFKKLRERIGRKMLRVAGVRHRFDYKGFSDIHTIGILFNAGKKEDAEILKKYMSYLREMGKKPKALGFYPQGPIPEMTYSRLEYEFFNSKQLDFLRRPKLAAADQFIAEPFDMLIDLNLEGLFPLYYIAAGSSAKLKVGIRRGDSPIYDLMVDMEPAKGVKFFLKNVDQYLEMLSPRSAIPK